MPTIDKFLQHPDSRQIAAFFIGWVFTTSLLCIAFSPTIIWLKRWLPTFFRRVRFSFPGHIAEPSTEKTKGSVDVFTSYKDVRSSSGDVDCIVVPMLSICFVFSSLADFLSLLTFTATTGTFACALFITWSGISGVCARLLGLTALCFDLKRLGAAKPEICVIGVGVIAVLALAFAEYVIGTGAPRYIAQLNTYVCYSTRYLPVSLTRTIVHTILDLYVLGRLVSLVSPGFLVLRHHIGVIKDTKVMRAISLLISEVLLIAPNVRSVGIVGDSILINVGSLLVLASFYKSAPGLDDLDEWATLLAPSVASTSHLSHWSKSVGPGNHISVPDHPFAMDTSSSSTISIRPSTFLPNVLISPESFASRTSSMRTTMVRVASMSRYTHAGDVLTANSERVAEGTVPCIEDGEPLDHYFSRLERLGIFDHQRRYTHSVEQRKVKSKESPVPSSCYTATPCNENFLGPVSTHPTVEEPTCTSSYVDPSIPLGRTDLDMEYRCCRPHTQCSTAASSALTAGTSQQSWLSLLKPVDPLLLYSDKDNHWLTFGSSSSSPIRRQRFSDRSQLVTRLIMAPADTFETQFRSLRLEYQHTSRDGHVRSSDSTSMRIVEEKAKGMTDGVSSAGPGERASVAPRKTKARLRGPRPLPRALPPIAASEGHATPESFV